MILDDVAAKRKEQLKCEMVKTPFADIKRKAALVRPPKDFKKALQKGRIAVIAEIKKASPSKGLICPDFHPDKIAQSYEKAGADAISVLTEESFFCGSSDVLKQVRASSSLPILRKDFIISPYQIYEAKAAGADAILLIGAMLSENTLGNFKQLSDLLGLASLMEAHNEQELEKVINAGAEIIGINNRDLKTFSVDNGTTARLAPMVPKECVLVSESGVTSRKDMVAAEKAGADAVLIGEALMRSSNVSVSLKKLRGLP
jgi:indole-3-glycerol phosphate synthase